MALAIPSITITTADGQLGGVAPDASGVVAIIGTSTSGTANQVYEFAGNAGGLVASTLGDGTLSDWVRNHLARSGGRATLAVRGTGATAGSNGTVTQTGSGPLPTLTGTATEDAQLKITIITGGAVGTATFKYSLDGGRTYSATKTTAASYAIGNGVTIVFTAGTYVAAEVYSVTLTGPRNSVGNVGTALDALLNSGYSFGMVHILGHAADATDTATLIAAVQTKMASAGLQGKFPAFAVVEAPPVDPALIVTALGSIAASEVVIAAGFHQLSDTADNTIEFVSSARSIVPRLARNPISVEASRRQDDSDLDPLDGVVAIYPNEATGTDGYIDAFRLPSLNNARASTLLRYPGRAGFYVANVMTLAADGSDYSRATNKRVISRARQVLYVGAFRHLQRRLRLDPSTGFIDEGTATAIDRDLEGQLFTALVSGGHASAVQVVTNRNDALLSDPTLRIKARIVPVGYAQAIEIELGFAATI